MRHIHMHGVQIMMKATTRLINLSATSCTKSILKFSSAVPDPPPCPNTPPESNKTSSSVHSTMQRLVGYPVPFLSLRNVLGNNNLTQNLLAHIQRLLSSHHPVVKHMKWFINNNYNMSYTNGMLTLLISKCINMINPMLPDLDRFGILPSQRTLAEITEIIHIADMIHHEVVELPIDKESIKTDVMNDLSFGNKIIILGGDILLARASKDLALLYKPQIVHLISQAISDINLARFSSLSAASQPSTNNIHLHHQSNSLLGRTCESCAILAELDDEWQNTMMKFGFHLSYLRQVLKQFQYEKKPSEEHDKLYKYHSSQALNILDVLPDSESKLVLEDFITNTTSVNM